MATYIEYTGEVSVDDGTGVSEAFYTFTIQLSKVELDTIKSRYDAASATSPSVADCRPLMRAVLNKLIEQEG